MNFFLSLFSFLRSPLEGEQVRASDSVARTVGGNSSCCLIPHQFLTPLSLKIDSPSRGELKPVVGGLNDC